MSLTLSICRNLTISWLKQQPELDIHAKLQRIEVRAWLVLRDTYTSHLSYMLRVKERVSVILMSCVLGSWHNSGREEK